MVQDTPASFIRLYNRGFGWLTYFLLPFAIVFTLIAMFEGRKFERLRDEGVTVTATITDKDIEITTDSDGDKSTTYYLSYDFLAGTRPVSDRDSVGRGFYNSLSIGDRTELRYWGPDPDVNEIEPGSTRTTIWITKVLAVILLTGVGAWTERCWRKASRAIRVRDRGERTTATVTGHYKTGVSVNKRPRFRLEWRDERGRGGRSFLHPKNVLDLYPVGSEVTVYADPQGRLASVWEADVGPRKAQP